MSRKTHQNKDSNYSPQKRGDRGGPSGGDQHSLQNDKLKCLICNNDYSYTNKPIAFPCGHTFCSVCIEQQWIISEEKARNSDEELKENEPLLQCMMRCEGKYSRE